MVTQEDTRTLQDLIAELRGQVPRWTYKDIGLAIGYHDVVVRQWVTGAKEPAHERCVGIALRTLLGTSPPSRESERRHDLH